ncbi:MAG: hypothetical protein HY692_08475 [Cyanobacteria bacterium NC_groundwater_1444_Ag_S-0.65um_54_12]|nr:hypothetical protein [Cyanobacteria bacterium NC_groundwater_1444_Ag_S-0.65um_54_12]
MPKRISSKTGDAVHLTTSSTAPLVKMADTPSVSENERRFKLDRDSRRGMKGQAFRRIADRSNPMTLDELLAKLDTDQRTAVLAMSEDRQRQLLALYEALDRRLQAPGAHKAATMMKLATMITNGRLLQQRRAEEPLLCHLTASLNMPTTGPLAGRLDGLTYLSYVINLLAEPQPVPAPQRSPDEQAIAVLANSLALGWPARWGAITVALAFAGSWQGILPVWRPGGAPPDGLLQGSLLAYARTLSPVAATRKNAKRDCLPLAIQQLDLLARLLESDRGAEIMVGEHNANWATNWLVSQLAANYPARAGVILDGKGQTLKLQALEKQTVTCDGIVLSSTAFFTGLRRVLVDGSYLALVSLL